MSLKLSAIGDLVRQASVEGMPEVDEVTDLYNEEVHRGGSSKVSTHGLDPFAFEDDRLAQIYEK